MHHYEFSSSGASNNYPMRDSESSDVFDTKRVLQFDDNSDVFLQKQSSQLSQVDDQKLRQQLFYQRS